LYQIEAFTQGEKSDMSTYSAEQLLANWKQEDMTAEQAVGHLLQHLTIVYERLRKLERAEQMRQTEQTERMERAEQTGQTGRTGRTGRSKAVGAGTALETMPHSGNRANNHEYHE
jgi:hypothetical protein